MLYSKQFFGGAVELSSCSLHLCNAVVEAHLAYLADRDGYPGQVPVFSCTGVMPSKDKFGINYRPILQLVKWTPGRPSCRTCRPARASRRQSAPVPPQRHGRATAAAARQRI